jgi:hypothetical protein
VELDLKTQKPFSLFLLESSRMRASKSFSQEERFLGLSTYFVVYLKSRDWLFSFLHKIKQPAVGPTVLLALVFYFTFLL